MVKTLPEFPAMPFPFRAVLFDFDGTLADSYDAITASVNHVRTHRELEPLHEREVRTLVGHGLLQLMADVVPGSDPEANAALYREHHPSVMFELTRLLPDVLDVLQQLHAQGVRLGVCSNKPVAITRKLIAALAIDAYIPLDAAFGPEDAQNPKPDPGMAFAAMKRLGVSVGETLFVGDMTIDIHTARAAGVNVWVLPTGSSDLHALQHAGPDRIMLRMAEMLEANNEPRPSGSG